MRCKRFIVGKLICFITPLGLLADAAANSSTEADSRGIHEEVFVTGGQETISTSTGSATFVGEEAIAEFEVTDLNALLTQVPGVYIRQEDGFGLRPNISIRGTNGDRSSKITIMEDSMLIGPAPYSAPAAYYIPNVARMEALEVFKGPSSIEYGPHTVGGAINFVTRAIPETRTGELAVAVGSFGSQKYRVFYGDNDDSFGYWIDVLHYSSDGFKELDGGGDTGFARNDINAKLLWRLGEKSGIYQELMIKLGYADEDADETYLGLTEADFASNPNRRYAASQLDHFESDHQQIHVVHTADFEGNWKLITRAYHNRFNRAWNKFDGFIGTERLNALLTDPSFYASESRLAFYSPEFESLRGPTGNSVIDITNNDRSFEISGVQVELEFDATTGKLLHELALGLRFHRDSVERDHRQRGYLMQEGTLVFDGEDRPSKALNEGETDALALFIRDEISIDAWKIHLGLRVESIDASFNERSPVRVARDQAESHSMVMPGVGVYYAFTDAFGFLAGVHKGFSTTSASAPVEVDSEESINYEAGFRYRAGNTALDAVAFFSDYTNLLGRCRASDPCAGDEVNGGEVEAAGLELNVQHSWNFDNGIELPVSLIYTYTDAEFTTSFESDFSQWGDIEAGFELPYLPEFQGRAQAGLRYQRWSASLAIKYVSEMRERAGIGEYEPGLFTEALTTFDTSMQYQLNDALALKLVVENIADEQKIISRRPFGARPNQPRTLKFGATYTF